MASAVPIAKRRIAKGAGSVRAPKKHQAPHGDALERLSNAIVEIQQHNASKLSFEEHYRHAYNLVLHKQGHNLYNRVAELVIAHLESETKEKIVPVFPPSTSSAGLAGASTSGTASHAAENVAAAAAGELLLDRLREVWEDHKACMSKLGDVLKYMDKQYTGSTTAPVVWDLGLAIFLHHVLLYSTNPKPVPAPTSRAAPPSNAPRPTQDSSYVVHHLVRTLLDIIRIEREGEVVARHTIQSAVEILCELTDETLVQLPLAGSVGTGSGSPVLAGGGSSAATRKRAVMGEGTPGEKESPYKTSFEKAFLDETKVFYEQESARLLVELDCPELLRRIERRLDEETTRAQSFLAPSTESPLISLLEATLLTTHLQAILDHPASGLPVLIAESRVEDLNRLHRLFHRVSNGPGKLAGGISAWIVAMGKQVNEGLVTAQQADKEGGEAEEQPEVDGDASMKADKGKGKEKEKGKAKGEAVGALHAKTRAALDWVQNVLELKAKFDLLLSDAFGGDKALEKTINDAFTSFVNQNPRSPEYISLFIDENLKKGLKGKTENEIEDVLNKTIELFRFLTEKDSFEKYYNQHLSKRLLGHRSISDDAERNMLAKFKIEAGAAFTKSAEGMIKDMKTSEDAIPEYKRWQDRSPPSDCAPFDMAATVCTSNYWPMPAMDRAPILPTILQRGIDSFTKFYGTKHSGRKLEFRVDMGNVEVKTRFKARSHELTVSTSAMLVLSLFEGVADGETLSYNDILAATNLVPSDLKRTLQSLACAKYKVLTKHPKGRDIEEDDSFAFNDGFTSNLAKIKIQSVAGRIETPDERKATEAKVDEMRKNATEACIVRVMKDRKVLNHGELLSDVTAILSRRFTPQVVMIKQTIEALIDREYLERDDKDRRLLKYLA